MRWQSVNTSTMESLADENAGISSELLLLRAAESMRCSESATCMESLRASSAESRTVSRDVFGTALLKTLRAPRRPAFWAGTMFAVRVNSNKTETIRCSNLKLQLIC
jgi:hypothetical protein